MVTYTPVDRILARLHREMPETSLEEGDAIEWIGEALSFMQVYSVEVQAVFFTEVENYECKIPKNLTSILQIARNCNYDKEDKTACILPAEVVAEVTEESSDTDCKDDILDFYKPSYIPNFDMQWQYIPWSSSEYYTQNYVPVRLADHTFFNSIVCKEKKDSPYTNNYDEYTIIGTTEKSLRFSFKEGYIAVSYTRAAVDEKTGYPLIPDNSGHIAAVSSYVKWKMAERMSWSGREGAANLTGYYQQQWLKYVKQANNYAKMPKGIDEYQDLLEQTHHLLPRRHRYYGFFGNLSRKEDRIFNDPDHNRTSF